MTCLALGRENRTYFLLEIVGPGVLAKGQTASRQTSHESQRPLHHLSIYHTGNASREAVETAWSSELSGEKGRGCSMPTTRCDNIQGEKGSGGYDAFPFEIGCFRTPCVSVGGSDHSGH